MKVVAGALIAVLLVVAAFVWWRFSGDVSHREIYDRLGDESAKIQQKVDARCDALDRKLDRIESKLDRLLEIAHRPLPDGMKAVE